VEKDFAAVSKQWEELKTADLAALNRQLREANLPEIKLISKSEAEDDSGDVE